VAALGQAERDGRVSTIPEIAPLLSPLTAIHRMLSRFDGHGLIIGGVAVSLLGAPRLTADVDLVMLLSVDRLSELMKAALAVGLTPRIEHAEAFARRNRVLLLRHDESGIAVDVSLGMLPFEKEAIERSSVFRIGDLELRLPSPEDLIIMKAVAHRPKDLLDISGIVRMHPDLDRLRVERWVSDFAEALDQPELWSDIAPLLAD
jgi:hypothetical protein